MPQQSARLTLGDELVHHMDAIAAGLGGRDPSFVESFRTVIEYIAAAGSKKRSG